MMNVIFLNGVFLLNKKMVINIILYIKQKKNKKFMTNSYYICFI